MSALPDLKICPDSGPGTVASHIDPGPSSPLEPAVSAHPAPEDKPDVTRETGMRSRRSRELHCGSMIGAPARSEAAAAARGTTLDYKRMILARSGVVNMSQALPIDLGAPLDTIVASCAKIAKIAPSTAALAIAAMAAAAMGRALIGHGQDSSDRTVAAGLSLALVTRNSAGAGADLAVQVALEVEATDSADRASAGSQADGEAFREMVAACAARGYDVAPAKSAKAAKPTARTLVLETATLRALEKVWPGVGAGLLVVARDSMPILPPGAGPVGAMQGHLDGLQLGNAAKVGEVTRRCSVSVIGAFSPDALDGARLRDGAYGGVISRMLWAPCDGARRAIDPPSELVAAMTRLIAAKSDDGRTLDFCLDGEAARRLHRISETWTTNAQEKMPPLRHAYEGAAETMLRIAAALHALSAAVSTKPIDRLISIGAVRAAISLVNASLEMAESVLGPVSVSLELLQARAVAEWLRGAKGAGAQFTLGEVERALSGAVKPLDVRNAVKALCENTLIEREEQMTTGRVSYKVVPGLFN